MDVLGRRAIAKAVQAIGYTPPAGDRVAGFAKHNPAPKSLINLASKSNPQNVDPKSLCALASFAVNHLPRSTLSRSSPTSRISATPENFFPQF